MRLIFAYFCPKITLRLYWTLYNHLFSDCKPLWAFEDITPRNGTIKSADQLESFLQIIIQLFDDALPNALLPGRWARESLHWATSCSSRHYAGRSFQIFRSLKIPLSWPMLSDILQRLVESVADNSDDVQVWNTSAKENKKAIIISVILNMITLLLSFLFYYCYC